LAGPLPLLLSLGVALCALRTAFLTTQCVPNSPPLMVRSARKAAGAWMVQIPSCITKYLDMDVIYPEVEI